jgi:hypothetical protein
MRAGYQQNPVLIFILSGAPFPRHSRIERVTMAAHDHLGRRKRSRGNPHILFLEKRR